MRIHRNASRITLAAALVTALATGSTFAQTPAPSQPAQAPPAGALGAKPAAPAEEPPTEAEKLIDAAIPKVAAVKTVSATLAQSVKMMGQSFQVKGRYLKAPGSRVLLRLDVAGLPGSTGTILQVSNGDVLWNFQKLLDSPSYSKLSVKPVLERLQAPEVDKQVREQILSSLGFTGPEMLLSGVRSAVRFDQIEEGDLDGRPVWIARGAWRDRAGLAVPEGRPVPQVGLLPSYVPSLATLTFDKENGWPYKLELQGRPETMLIDKRTTTLDGKRITTKSASDKQEKPEPSDLVLVYSDVKFDPSLSDADFAFQAPPDATVDDNTEMILQGLSRMIEAQAQQKRMEAANAAASAPAPTPAPTTKPVENPPATPPAAETPK
ncbi:LolA family protein [Paludisphaera rhizosphaerae]|uniref:LolA family protein n=1 Tax=Paludisphaera rhizosphaerae TaxID=2711216 RepID=UPI0013EB953A|nr:hypothetical protein [Paludisphaera rhizosphaerae]